MKLAEKVELVLIPVVGAGLWLAAPALPDRVGLGRLLLAASALLLLQSLVRDLWLLAKQRRAAKSDRRPARCMCVESTVGITGVIVGAILLGAGIGRPIALNHWTWSLLAMTVLVIGFVMKDLVVEWGPFRIRRDKDHLNIVFTWKK